MKTLRKLLASFENLANAADRFAAALSYLSEQVFEHQQIWPEAAGDSPPHEEPAASANGAARPKAKARA